MAEEKWFSRSNVIAIVGIGIGALVGLFGAAFSLPGGQRILCGVDPMFCRAVPITNGVVAVAAFDQRAFCADRMRGYDPNDLPPGLLGLPSDGSGGCGEIDLAASPAFDALDRLETTPAGRDGVLAVQMSFDHAPVRKPTAFSVRVACSFHAPDARAWVEQSCALADPVLGSEPFVVQAEPSARARGELIPDTQLYGQVFRLTLNGNASLAALEPGAYRVILSIGGGDELIEESRFETTFEIAQP